MKYFVNWWKSLDLDPRALALSRIIFSTLCLYDLFELVSNFEYFLSNKGLFTSNASFKLYEFGNWSLNRLFESDITTWICLIGAILAYVFLLIGKRTSISALIAWLLYSNLCLRNQLIFTPLDFLKLGYTFWLIFQPTGLLYSLGKDKASTSKFASFGLLVFICSVFIVPSFLKSYNDWVVQGEAMYYALALETNWTPLTSFVLNSIEIYKPLSHFIYFFEFSIGFLILFSTKRTRNLLILLLIVFLLFKSLFIDSTFYSLIVFSILVSLLNLKTNLKVNQSLHKNSITVFISLAQIVIFTFYCQGKPSPSGLKFIENSFQIVKKWDFYVTHPKQTIWYRVLGITNNNEHYDLLSNKKDDYFDKLIPGKDSKYIYSKRWKNYFNNLETYIGSEKYHKLIIEPLLNFYCDKGNLKEVSIVKVTKEIKTKLKQDTKAKEKNLVKKYCQKE